MWRALFRLILIVVRWRVGFHYPLSERVRMHNAFIDVLIENMCSMSPAAKKMSTAHLHSPAVLLKKRNPKDQSPVFPMYLYVYS